MKNKYIGNTPMEGIVTFTKFPACIKTSCLASLSGHSSSCIESQWSAIERVSLWSTHNTQELVINMFNHNSQELFLWPAFYTSIACMTFIHELDIPVFTLFAFILLTVLLLIILLLSEEAPNLRVALAPDFLGVKVSLTPFGHFL